MKQIALPIFAFAGIAAMAAPAYAQSDSHSDGGAHVEAQLGWDHLPIPDQTGNSATASDANRLLFGVGAGYDVSLGHGVIAGLDTNLDFGGKSNCASSVVTAGDSLCGKLVSDWDIGARLGVKTGVGLLYGRVAYDLSRVRSTYGPGDGTTTAVSSSQGGLRLGAGLEIPLVGKTYLKTEYRYTTASQLPAQQQVVAAVGVKF